MNKILKFGRLNLKDLLSLYRGKIKEIFEVFEKVCVLKINKNDNTLKIEVIFFNSKL
jgi:hypothetical protein